MNLPVQIPLPLSGSWPVGVRLRFRLDAPVKPQFRYLRGTPVLVLGPLTYLEENNQWRQYVAAFGARWESHRYGWALPEQLEPIPGEGDDPVMQLGEEARPGSGARAPEAEVA